MSKFRKLMAAGVVTLAGAALAACGNNSSSSSAGGGKKTLNWMDKTEIEGMDVAKVTDATSFTQLNNTMEGLYRLGKNSKVENALATKTTTSKDGRTWTFTLRKDDKWSNGDPVTAKTSSILGVEPLLQALVHNIHTYSRVLKMRMPL